MLTTSYSIEELAEETGFDKRVIRSFIEQGLLCGPDSKGRYARYTNAHLIRLRAIRLLRDQRQLTLGEIRAALLSMTEEDIQALSAKVVPESPRVSSPSSSVLEYLRLARNQSAPATPETRGALTASHRLSALDRLMNILQEDIGAKRLAPHGKGQLWHRFAVTPDIEFSVRGLQDGGQIEQWERIADSLREILLGGTKDG